MAAKTLAWILPAALLAACAPLPPVDGVPAAPSAAGSASKPAKTGKTDPAITSALVNLLQNEDREKVDLTQAQGTPLGDILVVGSPIGYALRNRYLNIGIPIAEGLSRDTDPDLRAKLVEMARWERDPEVRSGALVALARQRRLDDLRVFNEALTNIDPAVRFGAMEAFTVWGHPAQALPLLSAAAERDHEPILKVYAASAIAKLGDKSGLLRLRSFLDDPSWLVRAMAARYLGDYGTAEDYGLLVGRIGREQTNDFTSAEFCIAALKLFPKTVPPQQASAPQQASQQDANPEPPVPLGDDTLVITAPRLKIHAEGLDPQINATLLRLLQQRMDSRPGALEASDPSLQALNNLTTLTGYGLKTRYTELGFLLTEGLAGVKDYQLAQELENVAKLGSNVQTRAAAMVALAYTHDLQYLSLFQGAGQDPNITVRFGALEALLTLGDPSVQLLVSNIARTDPSIVVQLYAAAADWKMGDIYGREILLRHYQDNDWFVRAMADHYLGELGGGDEYDRLFTQLTGEDNPQAKAELCSALARLQRFKEGD
ncbi:MAG: HEAT repeat domain-containing protein [Elusimicrobia bacterium]|nr:HEAT repeat domain-containing protein [Elusimicrobiota bacterium]MDE2236481.1 HEAT repeat domain-containing protein [Elusimicrobiota bacterium]MDE2425411.1 HEAT repeat domain-containing protein [Elusimicrobiota bacterium]